MAAQAFDPDHLDAYGAELLRRIAGTVAIMLYELELRRDGSFECLTFVGLEALIGPVPDGMSSEEAYDAAVHPDDRDVYGRAMDGLWEGEPVEIEYRLVGTDGEVRWVLDRMQPERHLDDGALLVSGVVADITARKRAEDEAMGKLAHAARHDSLTGLSNRAAFLEHLELGLKRAARTGSGLGVLFIDLDNFKLVNDSFGHAAGDKLLNAVGARLESTVRGMDVVARHGGDEFLVLLTDLESDASDPSRASRAAETVAGKIRAALHEPFVVEEIEIYINASIGISVFPVDGDDAATLMKHADVAMYSVKESGRDGYARYSDDGDTALEQISTAARLRRSVESGRGLVLHYQPLLNLVTAEIVGVEALVRWRDGDRGLVPPDEFIPLAEQVGLIGSLSDWVVGEACRQASAWQKEGFDFYVSVNVPPSYCQPTGVAHIAAAAKAAGIGLDRLMIEVTESALAPGKRAQLEDTLGELREQGLKLAIDDFGTGYSSLGRLNETWVHMVKIDRSFVQQLPESDHARNLVASVVQLAHALGLEPLAEGVETEEQRRFLVDHGCRYGQGFLFSRPLPTDQVTAFYRREQPAGRRVA